MRPGVAILVLIPLMLAAAAKGEPQGLPSTPSATIAAARTDTNSLIAHEQLLEKARQGRIDVYFIGDSITRRWGAADVQYKPLLENWTTNFYGWNAANFGWGADRIENILWRLEHGELDGVNPKIVVMLAGINNIGTSPCNPQKIADIAEGLKVLLHTVRTKAPKSTVILTGIFPRNDTTAVLPAINQINDNLARLADGKTVRYININAKLADADGRFFPGMVNADQLHPTVKAYQVWADALKPIFKEVLGSPARIDQAPKPTGDPNAQMR